MQPLYAEDPSSQTVGAFNTSLWQYQPKIATDLSGYADGGVAPLVSSFLRSDISQQLANSLISQTSQRRVASAPSSLTLSRATGSLQDPLRALVQAPAHRYPPTPLQDPPAAVPRTKAYICPLYSCGRFYRERWFLMEHIYSHAAHKPYQCERCFKQFSRADHFSQHRQRHARADSGDHQAILDLEREDEDEVMLMGEKCEVEVHGEVEDVAGGKGELRGLGIVCVYPWNPAGETMILNPTDNLPYSGVSSKHPEHDSMAHWRAHPDRGLFSTSRNAPPVERWPQDLESTWETPKNYESLERGASPVNTQFALACMQSSDGDGLFPASDSGGALGRHGIATPLQFHRSMAAAMRRTSADGPEEVDFAKSSSRYHPFENTYAPPVEALLTHPVNQNDSRPPRTASSTKKRLNAESTNHESNRDRHHDVRSQKRRKKQASPSLSRPSEQPVDSTLDANDTEQLRSQDSSMYSILDRPSTDATVRYASSMDNTVSSFPATGGRSFGEECVENDGKRIDLISPRHLGALNDNQQAIHPGLNQV
ncbi:homeodomain transcription factor ste12 [Ceratobasidium sp. 392]|nr:homeodomain transcription factor ste12 [Ceratobasidium sp. 392]